MVNGTQTSSFGVSARLNHDSSKFYNSKMYKEINLNGNKTFEKENFISQKYLNKIFCSSSKNMKELPDKSVHLMITSPPYNVGKDYDEDLSFYPGTPYSCFSTQDSILARSRLSQRTRLSIASRTCLKVRSTPCIL